MTVTHKTICHEQMYNFLSKNSQGGQVGYTPTFHPDSLGLTPAWGSQQKKLNKTT